MAKKKRNAKTPSTMSASEQLMWKVYAGLLGTVTAAVATKALDAVWKASTGDKPPAPNDLEASGARAITFAVVSAAVMTGVQVLTNRTAQRQFANTLGIRTQAKNV